LHAEEVLVDLQHRLIAGKNIFRDPLRISKSRRKVRTLRDAREGYRGGKTVFNPVHIASMGTTAQTRRDAAAYGRLCVDEGCDTID
jgi:hypothetical protein